MNTKEVEIKKVGLSPCWWLAGYKQFSIYLKVLLIHPPSPQALGIQSCATKMTVLEKMMELHPAYRWNYMR